MTNKKIEALRQWMKKEKVDAFLIPRADQYQGEMVAPCDERLSWLTGFDGSAGLAVVTEKDAALFVDGRYTLQAPAQVDTDIFEICQVPKAKATDWVKERLGGIGIVSFDHWLHPLFHIRTYKKAFDGSGIVMKALPSNPIDAIWDDRPERERQPVWQHDLSYTGKTSSDKRQSIKEALEKNDLSAALITDPESVSWLFNIRGKDVDNTPLVHSYAWVREIGDDILFIDQEKIGADIVLDDDVAVEELSKIETHLKTISEIGTTVQIDPKNCPYALYNALTGCGVSLKEADDPCLLPKACKNDVEIEGARQAHLLDGVALIKFLHWFEGQKGLDELTVVEKLHSCRAECDAFVEDSFDTIAGFGSNGAIVHYRATNKTNLPIEGDSLLLLDSGGQYHYGTTDITRTIAVGTPSQEMIDYNTRVLKGMIAVSMARFPAGTTGAGIDTYARHALWQVGADYAHGTGHGVGSFLSVHEGPQGISSRSMTPLKPGMILSNEPGYYKEGEYGIRIENLVVVVDDTCEADTQPIYAFETLTLVPIDRRLINEDLLDDTEKAWLGNYHAHVFEELSPHLSSEEAGWLKGIL